MGLSKNPAISVMEHKIYDHGLRWPCERAKSEALFSPDRVDLPDTHYKLSVNSTIQIN